MHNNVNESPPINRPFWTLIRLQTHNVRNCVDWRAGGLEAGGLADWRTGGSPLLSLQTADMMILKTRTREKENEGITGELQGTPGNSRELQGTKGAKGTKGAMVSASDHRVRLTVRG